MSDIAEKEFLEKIEPELRQLEEIRLDKLTIYNWRKKLGIVAAVVLTPFTAFLDLFLLNSCRGDDCGAGLSLAVLGAIYWWVSQPKRQYAKAYKQEILPDIAKLFGPFTYLADGKIPMEQLQPSKIIPSHDRYRSEDYFEGEYKGTKIRFSEISLSEKRGSGKNRKYVTVFRGLAILLSMGNRKFHGHTIMIRNAAKIMQWFEQKTKGLQRADLVDPEFEKMFDVYTNDQTEARYLIDPKIIERLKQMQEIYNSEGISSAYYNNHLLILIPSKANLFEPAGLHVSAMNKETVLKMKQEVGHILYIVDHLDLYDPAAAAQSASSGSKSL